MKILLNPIIVLACASICSCSNSLTGEAEPAQKDSMISDALIIADEPNNLLESTNEYDKEIDTITTIKFNELSISINRLIITNDGVNIDEVQKDTARIYVELGETIENQLISISSEQLIDFTVEQQYETSVTIMNDGPHCDLTDWDHYYSDWNLLKKNEMGQFVCDSYNETDWEKFPQIDMEALKEAVKNQCGDRWYDMVKSIKSPTEYPIAVSISRYFLKITGKNKDNGQTIIKLIIVEKPMGC